MKAKPKPKGMTRSGLAKQYNVHLNTLKGWMKMHPELDFLNNGTRVLTPLQVSKIFELLGNPDN